MGQIYQLVYVFCFVLLGQGVLAAEKQSLPSNFEDWERIHKIYMDAQSVLQPDSKIPQIKFSEKEYEILLKDTKVREFYLTQMDTIVEECSARMEVLECKTLLHQVGKLDLNECLGGLEFTFANGAIEELNEDLEKVILTGSGFNLKPFEKYSNSQSVEKLVARLRRNLTKVCTVEGCPKKRNPGSIGKCLRYVKLGMMAGGFTSSYSGTKHAGDYGRDLKGMGFKNLLSDSKYKGMTARTAPRGAVLVYSGGSSGHIEVKAGENEFLSDFRSARPVNEYLGRRLIGIYVK